MNKKLIAAALAGAFIAPAAMADVTIYGAIGAGVESVSATGATAGAAADYKSRTRVASELSILGFKGSEDLGNGLKAIWQVEQRIAIEGSSNGSNDANATTNDNGFANRNSFVGLQSNDFGRVILGRHDTAYKVYQNATGIDLMSYTTASILGSTQIHGRGQARANNAIAYMSPTWAGFDFAISHGVDETRAAANLGGNQQNAYRTSIAGKYSANGLTAALGYDRTNDWNATALNQRTGNVGEYYFAGVGYKFGDTYVGVDYEHTQKQRTNAADLKQDGWTVAASQQFGAFGLKASYSWLGKLKNGGNGVTTNDDDYKAKQWLIAGTYDLSKRTSAFAYYTKIYNNNQAAVDFTVNGLNNTTSTQGFGVGADPQVFGLGMRHLF